MNGNDAVSEIADRIEDQDPEELPEPASSLVERIQPYLSENAQSGNFAVVTGAVSLLRAARALHKGDRKRAALRVLGGLFWIGLAVAQRRASGGRSSVDQSDVADTTPDFEDMETAAEYGGEPATDGEVVDTTPADIDESDTAPELDSDVDSEDIDQTDVVGTDEVREMETDEGTTETGEETTETSEETTETDETTDTELGAEGVDAERDDSAMEFGEPEMDVGEVERESGGSEMDVGEMGTHVDEDEDESTG